MTSVYNFVDGSPYILNQLFGYQDAEESRQRPLRLRDALALQHRWVNTGASTPDIGTHYGNIGDVSNPANTVYYGDGSNLINLYKGGWADLSRAHPAVSGTLLAPNNLAGNRISNYSMFWSQPYSPGMTNGVWYRNHPPTTTGSDIVWNTFFLSGTFKLAMIMGVVASYGLSYIPVNPASYVEMVPYLLSATTGLYHDPSTGPVRFTHSYAPDGAYRNFLGGIRGNWQFTSLPADAYFLGWQTYCNNVGIAYGPESITTLGLDWAMMTRTPATLASYFFGWNVQLLGWYPVRPSFGFNLFCNAPMWTQD